MMEEKSEEVEDEKQEEVIDNNNEEGESQEDDDELEEGQEEGGEEPEEDKMPSSKAKGSKKSAKGPRYWHLRCFKCERNYHDTFITSVDFALGRIRGRVYICLECRFGEMITEHPAVKHLQKQYLERRQYGGAKVTRPKIKPGERNLPKTSQVKKKEGKPLSLAKISYKYNLDEEDIISACDMAGVRVIETDEGPSIKDHIRDLPLLISQLKSDHLIK